MADISAIFFILFIISIAFPSLLAAWWLLFPSLITRAQTRIEKTLSQSFWLGLIVIIALTVPIFILLALPFGPAKFLGWILLTASLAFSSIGSAGIAAHLGEQMKRAGNNYTSINAFIRGAVVLELAAFFPVIGWLFIWPIMLITAFGATGFALLNWSPREKTRTSSTTTSPSHA
jgi:bacteriorhodopsin